MCDTAPTSTQLATEARALLAGPPDEFVARRDARSKELRAAGDRAAAADVKALTKPTVALWGVLAAGADTDLVDEAYAATDALVTVQAAASDRDEVRTATARRRDAIDRLVRAAVESIGGGTDGRAQEVRDLFERLTRQPDLRSGWVEGTLRDVPDAGFGFDAFAAFDPAPAPAPAARVTRATPAAPPARRPTAAAEREREAPPVRPTGDAKAERARLAAAREEQERQRAARAAAKAEVAAAERSLASAQRQLEIATRAKEAADAAFDHAVEGVDSAQARVEAARAALP